MYWLVGLMGASVLATIAMGAFLELRPAGAPPLSARWAKGGLLANLLTFAVALAATLFLGIDDALAQAAAAGAKEVSTGVGMALIGVGIPTAGAAIGAGIALGPVGSSALAVLAEKPEAFGRTLIFMGLAEGIAIYGLVMSILMLGRI
ncbi:MAG: ATP synthase subunit C [Xanthomonadales bacterium]|nr:ATP synthase subunit C [Xanthomonadales bacterium]